jgi:dTDP-4-amino-4,6-dideoxygalactose transaminase
MGVIRLASPGIPEEDLQAVMEVLASGWLVQGKHVEAFERAIAELVGVEHAVAVNSGTSALHLALLGLGIGPGSAVAVPAYSFVATANVVELCGAEPVFIDVEPRTFNMDPGQLERALQRRAGAAPIAAIVPVHAFGLMADMAAIGELAERHGIPVMEDAACALGATSSGRQAGTLGRAGCFSFHPRKTITTGEGGMIVTGDAKLAAAARTLRNHGQEAGSSPPNFVVPGFNYRMTEFQAVLGATALGRLAGNVTARRRFAAHYDELLAGCVETPAVPAGSEHVYQSYVTLLPPAAAAGRGELIGRLAAGGVEAQIGTYNIPMTTYYRERYGYDAASFPVTGDVHARALALPMHEKLEAADRERVAELLREELDRAF